MPGSKDMTLGSRCSRTTRGKRQSRRYPEAGDEEPQHEKQPDRQGRDDEPDEDRGDGGTQHHSGEGCDTYFDLGEGRAHHDSYSRDLSPRRGHHT